MVSRTYGLYCFRQRLNNYKLKSQGEFLKFKGFKISRNKIKNMSYKFSSRRQISKGLVIVTGEDVIRINFITWGRLYIIMEIYIVMGK